MIYNTIPFFILVGAGAEVYLTSSMIKAPFKISRVKVRFRNGSTDNLVVKVFTGTSTNVPATGDPQGTNLFAGFIADGQFRGDNIVYDLLHEVKFTEGRHCIKVYGNNGGIVADYMCVLVTVVRKE